MKLGIFLVIVGGSIGMWFLLPVIFAFIIWVGSSEFTINWAITGFSLWVNIVGIFFGGVLALIGRDRIRKTRERNYQESAD